MSTQPTQRGSIDVESEMLPQDPPPWIMRWTAWILLGFLGFALLLAIVMKLPETVRCDFVLVPEQAADPIQSPRQGTIIQGVSEGAEVPKGAELFVLRSDEIRGWDIQLQTAQQELKNREESLKQAEAAYIAQQQIKKEEIEQARSEVGFRENHVKTSRDLVNRIERLASQGGESQVEFARMKLDLAGSEKDLSVAQRTLQQTTLDLKRMELEHAQRRGEQQTEITNLKTRIGGLQSDLENAHGNLLTVRSPYDAVVISVDQRAIGGFVQQGAILCQLSRKEAKPRARLVVSETGLPKISVPQKVRFFFEAFPYQRYGAVDGKLLWVSPSAVTTTDGNRFIALATLDRSDIGRTKGHAMPLRVGMRGIARIVVGGRTPIEYVLEPIHQLRENMRD